MALSLLHPGARWLFRLRAYTSLIILAIFISFWLVPLLVGVLSIVFPIISLSSAFYTWLFGILIYLVLIFVIGEIYTRMAYNRFLYEFTHTNLKVEKGIIWKRYSNIPYERVQNVDIHRGIIARMLGFSSVNIQTAGYSAPVRSGYGIHSEGYIPAVSIEEAEEIREFLMKKISKHSRSGL